ncbi:hypothetical protein DFH07DRAFT_772604 [Mycena maculata]|uniref:HMG domain-containing protein n=1 Tax=Mycena maculata TaxID=230809 RepID=A0AAD7J806_9AGAR|nr:hypothetical protein DFH07DRAFT_772604 [Mycena maculata]
MAWSILSILFFSNFFPTCLPRPKDRPFHLILKSMYMLCLLLTRQSTQIPLSSTSLEVGTFPFPDASFFLTAHITQNGNFLDVDEDEDEDEEPSTVKKGKGKKKRKKVEERKVEAKMRKGQEEIKDADSEVKYGFTGTSRDKNRGDLVAFPSDPLSGDGRVLYGLEEAVDSFFDDITVKEITCVLACMPRPSAHATCFLYNGITHTTACTNWGWDDVERESDVWVVNLLDANPEVKWETYHFRDLDTPISGPLDVRTSETISLLEQIVQATCGAASLNSDHGRVLAVHLPFPEHHSVLDLARAFLPDIDPTLLGQDRDLILETTICSRIDNEIAKDVPVEVYHGWCGTYWQATVGRGPHEHRHILRLLQPDIPTTGDCLTVYVSATLDFWQLLLCHILYLLHVLFLSRLLGVYQPLIIVTQSNPVAAMMCSDDLVTAWYLLEPKQHEQFEAGITPITAARLWDVTVAVDWTDPVQMRAWLEVVKGKAEEGQTRREGILAALRGCQRQEQLDAILERARELESFDIPPDPDHLGSFLHPIFSDSFQEWFLSLKDGTDVVYASNTLGRTEESHLAAQENQQVIGKWHRAHHIDVYVDQVVVLCKRLVKAVRETTGAGKVLIKDILSALRWGNCSICGISVIGSHNVVAHKYPVDRMVRHLTGKNFRNMECIQYVHEILNNDKMLAGLGPKPDILSEMALVKISVQTILDSQHDALQSTMPHDYLSLLPFLTSDADIYVKEDTQNDVYDLLTLAVDTVLATKSQCPPEFLPLEFDSHDAWSMSQSEMLLQWFKSPNVTALLNGTLHVQGYNCKLCSSKTCGDRRFLKVNTLLDLPPHHARHIWMVHCRGSKRVKALLSRKLVSRR